ASGQDFAFVEIELKSGASSMRGADEEPEGACAVKDADSSRRLSSPLRQRTLAPAGGTAIRALRPAPRLFRASQLLIAGETLRERRVVLGTDESCDPLLPSQRQAARGEPGS
ncbi:MAG TPA: hypothetical protein VHI54_07535, partial [Actinomycetota bacterium]|nr:hypothetical protein [Actinomycetota bacterium]